MRKTVWWSNYKSNFLGLLPICMVRTNDIATSTTSCNVQRHKIVLQFSIWLDFDSPQLFVFKAQVHNSLYSKHGFTMFVFKAQVHNIVCIQSTGSPVLLNTNNCGESPTQVTPVSVYKNSWTLLQVQLVLVILPLVDDSLWIVGYDVVVCIPKLFLQLPLHCSNCVSWVFSPTWMSCKCLCFLLGWLDSLRSGLIW